MDVADRFDYILTDITGTPRTEKWIAGAMQPASMNKRMNIVNLDECGPGWYTSLKADIEDIRSKTAF
jgi:hypothetical protein